MAGTLITPQNAYVVEEMKQTNQMVEYEDNKVGHLNLAKPKKIGKNQLTHVRK